MDTYIGGNYVHSSNLLLMSFVPLLLCWRDSSVLPLFRLILDFFFTDSYRLITLDKNPGVHPIGIGEAVQRIIVKAVLTVIGESVYSWMLTMMQLEEEQLLMP